MSDLRYDPISGIWVAIARNRRERPMEFVPVEQVNKQIICPFCYGNEDETPIPIAAYDENGKRLGSDDDPGSWSARIVPNKYPSLLLAPGQFDPGPYECSTMDGIQEIVIPTPRHITSISELEPFELHNCLLACQDRVRDLSKIDQIEHVMIFMNCRSEAGASLEHIHFQIMAAPVISHYLVSRHNRNEKHVASKKQSLLSTLLDWELSQEVRILEETDRFIMLCPFASRFAFQVWIAPKTSELAFDSTSEDFRPELSELISRYTCRLEELLEKPAYNLLLHLAPTKLNQNQHWFIEIFPRLNRMAGFEIGTEIWVNPVP
ncbi:MAG: DUF4921 family protein, partial [Planctomycetota bacterium]